MLGDPMGPDLSGGLDLETMGVDLENAGDHAAAFFEQPFTEKGVRTVAGIGSGVAVVLNGALAFGSSDTAFNSEGLVAGTSDALSFGALVGVTTSAAVFGLSATGYGYAQIVRAAGQGLQQIDGALEQVF
jgi:hypothetical protein